MILRHFERTWCQSNDPDFEVKKRHHRSLLSSSTERGVVRFDELGPLQTTPRGGRGWEKNRETAGVLSSQWNLVVVWSFLPNDWTIGGTRE